MPEAWNFHNYVALPLEKYSERCFGADYTSADQIDAGTFVDTMLRILVAEYRSLDEFTEFVGACREYAGISQLNIPAETAKQLYRDFELLVKNKNS